MSTEPSPSDRGPFRADQFRDGEPYELSNGHLVECPPLGGRAATAARDGGMLLGSDPDAAGVGIDAGFTPDPWALRAPHLAVGNLQDAPGWAPGAPLLAVEYADRGQDEPALAVKIRELLAACTRYFWVVRLDGPRYVEVHAPGREVRLAKPGELLEAPGILRNPVPVEALYDPEVGREVTLRNLLQRRGYDDLEAVLSAGRLLGLREALLEVLDARGLPLSEDARGAIGACADHATLKRWLRRAATATSAEAVGLTAN